MSLTADDVATITALAGERWYHVSDVANVPGILAAGLTPGRPSNWPAGMVRADCVYLASLEEAIGVLADPEGEIDWGDAVVSVALGDLDPDRLRADEDWFRPAGSQVSARSIELTQVVIDDPELIIEIAIERGTIAYAGVIPPELLRLEFVAPDGPHRRLRAALRDAIVAASRDGVLATVEFAQAYAAAVVERSA